MPSTTIVGYDGSGAARAAVRFARALASADGGDVVAATVFRPIPHIAGKGAATAADEEVNEAIRAEATQVSDTLTDEGVRKLVVAGDSAAEGLHRLAERESAVAIVVGTTHRGRLGRLVPGSVGERLLHGSVCPVAVVPEAWDRQGIDAVGVAFDGRGESRVAAQRAEELARRLDARLVVIGVHDPGIVSVPLAAPGPTPWHLQDEDRRRLEHEVGEIVAGLAPPVAGEARVLAGPAGPTLAEASHDLDLLVMGSRGYGPIRSALVGTVSRYVVDHAACPVLVLAGERRPRPEPAGADVATGAERGP